jgi:hypothetical protein
MSTKFKVEKIEGNWVIGTYSGNKFWAKIYTERSTYGIDRGMVSKLTWVGIEYDRGWSRGEDLRVKWQPLVDRLEKFSQTQKFMEASS